MGEALEEVPAGKSVKKSDSPRVHVCVVLSNWGCKGPLALLYGVTHLLVKHLDHIPLLGAVSGFLSVDGPELQMASYYDSPGEEVWRV